MTEKEEHAPYERFYEAGVKEAKHVATTLKAMSTDVEDMLGSGSYSVDYLGRELDHDGIHKAIDWLKERAEEAATLADKLNDAREILRSVEWWKAGDMDPSYLAEHMNEMLARMEKRAADAKKEQ